MMGHITVICLDYMRPRVGLGYLGDFSTGLVP